MSDIGPELPPHLLAKRKRKQQEDGASEAATTSSAMPSASPQDGEKRRRIVGPAMPPANLDERPAESPGHDDHSDSDGYDDDGDDDDDDDDFGPALPSSRKDEATPAVGIRESSTTEQGEATMPGEKLRRDEWMMMAPKQDDLAARMDPSKQRARAFNTAKGASAPQAGDDDSSAWYETPEQKQKRLADEMMGVSKPSGTAARRAPAASKAAASEASAHNIKRHTEKTRGPSLMETHQHSKGKEADDDPSARAFDREKDMGSGMRIGHSQRKQMLNHAAAFSSKFSGGGYL